MKILVKGLFSLAAMSLALGAAAELRITEICPKTAEVYDANGLESGWVELFNDGEEPVNLADYELQRFNLGKKASAGKFSCLPSKTVEPGGCFVVYTSDEYPNSEDEGGDGVTVETYASGYVVAPFKVNPKKFPLVRLLKGDEVLQTEYIPVDLVPGYSYCDRVIMPNPTKGAANDLTDALPYGPNAGPLFGIKHSLSVFDPLPRPRAGEAYEVKLPVNNYFGPAIESVTLHYQSGFATNAEKSVSMEKGQNDSKGAGQWWTATIPAEDIPAPGQMLRYYVTIKEVGDATEWRSPSFLNPDDGFQYFGTVVENDELDDPKLQTFHIFAEGDNIEQMDVDADKQDKTKVTYNARCDIFDVQTGHFYSNVRIDLRGNTSGGFRKKSHGLRFAKCHELVCKNPFDNSKIETRKTSFVAEYCDPAYIRQSLAFYIFRKAGCLVPFHYPVRLNLNGEFYQLAFHSDRFSDKLIEDHYELDKKGYGYKNSGCLSPTLKNWVQCEKKTPDDGDETSDKAKAPLKAWTTYFGSSLVNGVDDQPRVTKAVVETFDLPAWINYLAAARITMECDDSWANLSTYWDKRGTGTWMPLGYDMNQSLGHIYYGQWNGAKITPGEVMANPYACEDRHKAHPLFGGMRVLCYFPDGRRSHEGGENYAMEAIWQSTKFRRLYLRRLRTLMDEFLCPPGTSKEETPFWRDYVVAVTNATHECAILDYAKWREHKSNPAGPGTFWTETPTFCWTGKITHDQGVEDLWVNYIEPRRRHLYETHSIHNTAKGIGYAENLSAGIPDGQLPATSLGGCLSLVGQTADELILFNDCDDAIDLSGWTLSGGVKGTLPAGTVVDAKDTITLVRDRKSWIAANRGDLGDRVVVGNFDFAGSGDVVLTAAADAGGGAAPFVPSGRVFRWFDASVQNLERGTDVTTVDGTAFRGTFAAQGAAKGTVASRLGYRYVEVNGDVAADDRLVFAPQTVQKDRRVSTVEMTINFPAALPSLGDLPGALGALTLARGGNGEPVFCIYDGSAWRAVSHPSVVPAEDSAYRIRIMLDRKVAPPTVSYAVRSGAGWVDLADANGATAFPIAGKASSFAFSGFGEVGGFGGDYELLPGFGVRLR